MGWVGHPGHKETDRGPVERYSSEVKKTIIGVGNGHSTGSRMCVWNRDQLFSRAGDREVASNTVATKPLEKLFLFPTRLSECDGDGRAWGIYK